MISFRGQPVSAGIAVGAVYLPDAPPPDLTEPTLDDVRAAFAAVAADRAALADRLRAAGRDRDADIVAIGALIAADTALTGPALDAMRSGTPAVTAVRDAAQAQAVILESLPDPDLAQRAGDVRQVAAAVIAQLSLAAPPEPPDGPFILIRPDVDPADLIRLADEGAAGGGPVGAAGGRLVGAVSVGGGASSHAAIIARGLGLPMLAGADPAVLATQPGRQATLDATIGELVVDPAEPRFAFPPEPPARAAVPARGDDPPEPPARAAWQALGETGPGLAYTADGAVVTVLCNVASATETRLGLAGGAAGVGLLRTEIAFSRAGTWPSREEHLAALRPILGLLTGRKAVVRLLDFSGDKIPPFAGAEGLPALLAAPGALRDQLDAILAAGAGTDLAVMIPMVRSLDEISHVRGELAAAARAAGTDPPPLGIVVEVAATAAAADRFAPHADFFSIGTNDLSADVLRRDRADLDPSCAAQPPVLTLIARLVRTADRAGIGVSVCGDAAADPVVLPLLIGAGVRTLSVGAGSVPQVAHWVADIDTAEASATVAALVADEPHAS